MKIENSWGKKQSWKQKTNNLLPIFYIKDLTTNNDHVGDHVDNHDYPLAAFSNPLN